MHLSMRMFQKLSGDEAGILQSLVAAFGRLAPKMYNVEDLLNSANPYRETK